MMDAIKKLKDLESRGLAEAALSEIGTLSKSGDIRALKNYNKIAQLVRCRIAQSYETGFQRGWECALDRVADLVKRDSKHVKVP